MTKFKVGDYIQTIFGIRQITRYNNVNCSYKVIKNNLTTIGADIGTIETISRDYLDTSSYFNAKLIRAYNSTLWKVMNE